MSHGPYDSALKNLSQYQYQRNRHLTAMYDAEDLYQDAWIQLNVESAETGIPAEQLTEEQKVRVAVSRASERVFGKLRKRCSRGSAAEVQMDYEPPIVFLIPLWYSTSAFRSNLCPLMSGW